MRVNQWHFKTHIFEAVGNLFAYLLPGTVFGKGFKMMVLARTSITCNFTS